MTRLLPAAILTLLTSVASAQETPVAPPAQLPPPPAAGSPEATALVDNALQKMIAFGRGTFSTTVANDPTSMRGAGFPFGQNQTELRGGWSRDLVWAKHRRAEYVRRGNRLVAKEGDDGWKLRGSKLPSGRTIPFTIDPSLLFTALSTLPKAALTVAHVGVANSGGRDAVMLSVLLDNENASDFAESGAVPEAQGGMPFGDIVGMEPPKLTYHAHLVFYIDRENGDLLQLGAKVFEKNPMMANMGFAVQVVIGGAEEEEEVEEKEEEEPADPNAPRRWKSGFPVQKPEKDESLTTFTVKFTKHGLATPPELDDRAKTLLGLR